MMKKLRYKYYNKLITTRDKGNVQSLEHEKYELSFIINANCGAHTFAHDEIKKVNSIRIT